MAFTGLTETEETIFDLEEYQTTLINANTFNERYSHIYKMNYAVQTVERSVYNVLMLLGDVGGLYGLLFSVFAYFNMVFNFQNPENTLVTSLYQSKKKLEIASKQYAFKEYL